MAAMKSYLQQLENNEAILLMYLAGELPDADRAEVEQMLAADATLRSELEILRQTQQLAFDSLESLDDLTRPVLTPGEAQQRISKIMAEWLKGRRDILLRELAARGPMPWRRIGFAAAAMLLLGYYVWAVYDRLDHRPDLDHRSDTAASIQDDDGGFPHTPPPRPLSDDEKVALLSNSLEDPNADESELHVAEVAAVVPSDTENSDLGRVDSSQAGSDHQDSGHSADSNSVGEP